MAKLRHGDLQRASRANADDSRPVYSPSRAAGEATMTRIVETELGRVEGEPDAGVLAFRGIPYARPPIGARRFAAPEPPEPWTGVRSANAYGASAPQPPRRSEILPGSD